MKKKYVAFAVALLTFIVYLPALQNTFVKWDDGDYILKNPHIRSFDAAFFKWAFFDFYAANWHPLAWISHAIDYAVWGLNPMGHHLMNIILHAINSFVVVFLVSKLLEVLKQIATKKAKLAEFLTERAVLIAAGATGLLFGLHPVHVESVAWAAERKDLLCALFFMLSIITYVDYVKWLDTRTDQCKSLSLFLNKQYLFTGLFFVLALLSKPMAVTLPVVLLILDWYPLQRIQSLRKMRPILVEKLPFFALSLASSILTILAQRSGSALATTDLVPMSIRVFAAAQTLLMYLWKMVWPLDLSPFYQHYRQRTYFETLEYLAPIFVVIGITLACVWMAKKQKLWAAAWGYYFVMLIPVLGIIQVGSQLMADRYTYLPSLGPFLLMGLLAALIVRKTSAGGKRQTAIGIVSVAIAVMMIGSLAYLTVKQIAVWKDTVTLWSRVIEKDPSTVTAYKERGRMFDEIGLFDRAIQDFDTAIALAPRDYQNYFDRGSAWHKRGNLDKAREDYDRAIAQNPFYPGTYNNRGVLFVSTGLFRKAIEDFNQALAIAQQRADVYNNRGYAYFSTGKYENALKDFNRALNLDDNYAAAYFNRGNLYSKTGQKKLAQADFRKACDLGDADGCKALR